MIPKLEMIVWGCFFCKKIDTRQKDPERTPSMESCLLNGSIGFLCEQRKKILLFQDMNFKVSPNPLLLLSNDYKGYIVIKNYLVGTGAKHLKFTYMYIHIYHTHN